MIPRGDLAAGTGQLSKRFAPLGVKLVAGSEETAAPGRRRPAGTRLTVDQRRLIISAIEAATTDYVAAQAARISARTFREMRQRAEGRHPTRRSRPQLKAFFADVDGALPPRAQVRTRHPGRWGGDE